MNYVLIFNEELVFKLGKWDKYYNFLPTIYISLGCQIMELFAGITIALCAFYTLEH